MNPDDLAKIPKSQILRGPGLLKILPPQTRLFECSSSSDSHSSELSGPFSDVVYTKEVENKRIAKQLYGKDLYTAFSFSSEFKSAIEELKKEIIKGNPDYLKIDSIIEETKCEPSECVESTPNRITYEWHRFPGIDYEVEKEENEDEEAEDKGKDKESEKDKKKIRAKIWMDDDDDACDTMSGYWRLLMVFDKFRISPPWYDAYAEGQEHWLQTKPIPSEVLENSRRKCLNWLSNYFEN